MRVVKTPSESYARTNCVLLHPRDWDPNFRYVLVNDYHAFNAMVADAMVPGDIGTSMLHRRFANLSLNQDVRIRTFEPHKENPNCYLTILTLQVDFVKKQTETKEQFDMGEMKDLFIQFFDEQIFTEKQTLLFEFHGEDLILEVTGVTLVDFNGAGSQPDTTGGFRRGILMKDTVINFVKSATSSIRLVGGRSTSAPTALLQPNFSFEDLGIGGLDHEFSQIFRRAFASRIFPPHVVEKLGIQHVKGVLLYGPPGTGKTLMARQIGKMLNAREPQIVNGPEILNKYVGQSEENVRKLFAEAEKEYKARGEESSLHIIIFDELDAICKQRGSTGGGTGVGDSVVNQLLAKMDGVEQLNNILIIGMTNRLDMIDEALLRPGRLEIHMEISLPDEKGRVQILNVHTAKMRNGNLLKDDVNLEELARLTKNFSGAEIAGLVKSATSFAFNRHIKVGATVTVDADYDKIKIGMDDFLGALEEVHPAFGVAETELQQCVANGIIQYSKDIGRILSDGKLFVKQVQDSKVTPLVSVLLHGPPRSGKTALAAEIAMTSDFPFIKLISPETMVGFTEQAKMATINKVFNDAYKSPFSVIVIDAIERLLDYVAVGPRFSNNVLQTLLVLLKKVPQKNHRLLILGTTSSRRVLEEMELTDAFNEEIYVRNVEDLQGVDMVLRTLAVFGDRERDRSIQTLRSAGLESRIGVGIKRLIMMADMASRDEDKVDKFVTLMADQGVRASLEEAPKRGGFGIQGPSDQGDYAAGGVLQSYS